MRLAPTFSQFWRKCRGCKPEAIRQIRARIQPGDGSERDFLSGLVKAVGELAKGKPAANRVEPVGV